MKVFPPTCMYCKCGKDWGYKTCTVLKPTSTIKQPGHLTVTHMYSSLIIIVVTTANPLDEVSILTEEEPPAKRHKQNSQYLCTGYDAYLSMEPCVM